MTTYSWKSATSGDWSTPANWTPAGPPDASAADAIIGVSGTYTVTIAAKESFSVDSLTMSDPSADLQLLGTLALGGTSATLDLNSGTIVASGSIAGGTIAISGGTFSVTADESYTGDLESSGGTIAIASGAILTAQDAASLVGAATVLGPGTLTTLGTTAVTDGGYLFLGGGVTWNNKGTANLESNGYIEQTGTGTFNIVNASGAVFDITADNSRIGVTPGIGTFTNDGLLEKTGSTNTSAGHADNAGNHGRNRRRRKPCRPCDGAWSGHADNAGNHGRSRRRVSLPWWQCDVAQ